MATAYEELRLANIQRNSQYLKQRFPDAPASFGSKVSPSSRQRRAPKTPTVLSVAVRSSSRLRPTHTDRSVHQTRKRSAISLPQAEHVKHPRRAVRAEKQLPETVGAAPTALCTTVGNSSEHQSRAVPISNWVRGMQGMSSNQLLPGHEQVAGICPDTHGHYTLLAGEGANGNGWYGGRPQRSLADGAIQFDCFPDFRPTLTPAEVLHRGSFGGGYFRPISSSVTASKYDEAWKELPLEWVAELDVQTQVASPTYDKAQNKFGVGCGAKEGKSDAHGLMFWEGKGWIEAQDPFGWFMWYCRFFQGRRSDDDARQVSRWCKLAGGKGRWKQNLIGKCVMQSKVFNDETVSPVVRQTLQHWAYQLTESDFREGVKRVKMHGASYIPRQQLDAAFDHKPK